MRLGVAGWIVRQLPPNTPIYLQNWGGCGEGLPTPPSRTTLCLSPNEFMKSRSQALHLAGFRAAASTPARE